MKPRKLSDLLDTLSDRTGLPTPLLNQLARAYYRQVQLELSSLQHLNVDVTGLGVFVLKPKALERKIFNTKQMLEKMKLRTTLRAYKVVSELEQDLCILEELALHHSKEQVRKAAKRQSRHEQSAQSIPESESDFGGNS